MRNMSGADDESLRFEHLVQINDPRDPRIVPLSREQLWHGLVLRAEAPQLFIPWLDESTVRYGEGGELQRQLRFGSYLVKDRVQFRDRQSIHYEVEQPGSDASFSLTMRIEEPAPGELFVRFVYTARSEDHYARSPLAGLMKEAYRAADRDTIFRIRQFAAAGALDSDNSGGPDFRILQ